MVSGQQVEFITLSWSAILTVGWALKENGSDGCLTAFIYKIKSISYYFRSQERGRMAERVGWWTLPAGLRPCSGGNRRWSCRKLKPFGNSSRGPREPILEGLLFISHFDPSMISSTLQPILQPMFTKTLFTVVYTWCCWCTELGWSVVEVV